MMKISVALFLILLGLNVQAATPVGTYHGIDPETIPGVAVIRPDNIYYHSNKNITRVFFGKWQQQGNTVRFTPFQPERPFAVYGRYNPDMKGKMKISLMENDEWHNFYIGTSTEKMYPAFNFYLEDVSSNPILQFKYHTNPQGDCYPVIPDKQPEAFIEPADSLILALRHHSKHSWPARQYRYQLKGYNDIVIDYMGSYRPEIEAKIVKGGLTVSGRKSKKTASHGLPEPSFTASINAFVRYWQTPQEPLPLYRNADGDRVENINDTPDARYGEGPWYDQISRERILGNLYPHELIPMERYRFDKQRNTYILPIDKEDADYIKPENLRTTADGYTYRIQDTIDRYDPITPTDEALQGFHLLLDKLFPDSCDPLKSFF